MPQLDIRKKYTYGHKQQKKKQNQNPVVAVVAGLLPWSGDSASDIARKIVFLVSIAALTFAAIMILNFYFGAHEETAYGEYWQADHGNQNRVGISHEQWDIGLDNTMGSGVQLDEDGNIMILERYREFWEDNPEFVGYVSIDPWINYPVAQSQGDRYENFYLHHNFYRQPTENGTIYACKFGTFTPTSRPHNIILHGHNLITKNNFQPLTNYRDNFQFLKDNPVITFDTLFEPGQYKVFSVFQTNVEEALGEVYPFWRKNYFNTPDAFYEYVVEALDRSRVHTNVDLRYGDELITLATCDFSMLSEIRVVIVARRIREGESPDMDVDSFINLRENNGRDENGFMKYKMFDGFYLNVNGGRTWSGVRAWDTSLVEGVEDYLRKIG
jgi:sortase B